MYERAKANAEKASVIVARDAGSEHGRMTGRIIERWRAAAWLGSGSSEAAIDAYMTARAIAAVNHT